MKYLAIFIAAVIVGLPIEALASSGEGAKLFFGEGLLPKCITDAEEVRTGGFDCVTISIGHFTSLLLFLVAIGSFLYMLYAAFLYTTAFGDEAKVNQAKKTISYAIVGVIVASLASLLVQVLTDILNAN